MWLIYTFDRLLDARLLHARQRLAALPAPASPPENAHRFHRTHRLTFTLTAAFATLLIALLLPALPAALLGRYLILAAALFFWLLLIHFTSLALPKAFAPGLFFTAAVFLPVLHAQPILTLLPQALAFAALGILNCLLIQFWERHPTPAPNLTLNLFSYALMASPILLPSNVAFPVALSAAVLRLLSSQRARLHPITLRAAADLALLTPLLISTLSL